MIRRRGWLYALVVGTALLLPAASASAHCDTMSGPVVTAARAALETGNVNLALVWVQPQNEGEIRALFARTLEQRKAGESQRQAADQAFYEAFVRIHRAGEGAPFEGIKPAGTDLGPAIPAADKALETGMPDGLQVLLVNGVQDGLRTRYQDALAKRNYDANDVRAGRDYVKSYVGYTHYVEGVWETASRGPQDHVHEVVAHDAHGEHGAANSGEGGHAGHQDHLPWMLAGLFGVGLIGETGWLLRLRGGNPDRARRR